MRLKFLITMCFVIACSYMFAQSEGSNTLDNQVLIIYNEYTPVLKDANRIQFLPTIVDTIKVMPKFRYNVFPAKYKTNFQPTPINVAKVKGENLKPLDNGMVKLGVGNYWTPYIEAFYNSRRQKDYSLGVYAKHHSSHGKTKNSEKEKVYNGYANNIIEGFGKKFFPASSLSGKVGFTSDIVNYYGYNPEYIYPQDYIAIIPHKRSEMESVNYMRLYADAGFASTNISKYDFNYDVNFKYQYFFTSDKNNQHKVNLTFDANKMFNIHRVGLDGGYEFNKNHIDYLYENNLDYRESFLHLNPYYKLYSNNWQIILGLNTTGELGNNKTTKYHLYPNLFLQYNVSNVIIPYASFKGYTESNSLEHISRTNPFVSPINLNLLDNRYNYQVTNYAQVIDVGIKGNIAKNLYFHLNANYSKIDNMAFFVGLSDNTLSNSSYIPDKFIMEYLDVKRFSGYWEIALKNVWKFNFMLNGHYYHYADIENNEEPWHMPKFDLTLKTTYNFNEKLNIGMDVLVMGKRYAKSYDPIYIEIVHETKLKPIIDVSLHGEYKLSSNFGCFLELNNLTGQKQYYWNNYHSLGFNLLAGLKYLF